MDLHEVMPTYCGEGFVEADNPRACYLYECQHEARRRLGHEMIAALPAETEVCDWQEIYHDKGDGGVVFYPEACANKIYGQNTTFDAFLNGRYTNHSFTTETPTGWNLEKRVATQLTWLIVAANAAAGRSVVSP